MTKKFRTTGACDPAYNYMVDISDRLDQIKVLIDEGDYFTINRARQYGKTTTLKALKNFLKDTYVVISMDFQAISDSEFENEHVFTMAFLQTLLDVLQTDPEQLCAFSEEEIQRLNVLASRSDNFSLRQLFIELRKLCADSKKPVVLFIDEVDSASNYQVFLSFLAQLRYYFLNRDIYPTFQSVILAGVNDIKHIKMKMRSDSEHKNNSPWNIAADFNIDMSFNVKDIEGMLQEYEDDHHTGMHIHEIAQMIYDSTSGYPFLVSRLCELIDAKLSKKWDVQGFMEAEKLLLDENNTLFQSLTDKLENYPELKTMLKNILFEGRAYLYESSDPVISMASMYGFVKEADGKVAVANRIFETKLYNIFLSEEKTSNSLYLMATENKNQFITDGKLNMRYVLERFVETFTDLYEDKDPTFIEEVGRKYFLLFLRPIINGTGHYYVEARTRSSRRTDIIVDYNGKQYIIELKIWRGDQYHEDGEKQISDYLDYYKADTGYMLVFNFNRNKETGIKEICVNGKKIIEAIV